MNFNRFYIQINIIKQMLAPHKRSKDFREWYMTQDPQNTRDLLLEWFCPKLGLLKRRAHCQEQVAETSELPKRRSAYNVTGLITLRHLMSVGASRNCRPSSVNIFNVEKPCQNGVDYKSWATVTLRLANRDVLNYKMPRHHMVFLSE